MALLDKIREPVEPEVARYDEFLEAALNSSYDMTTSMLDYILDNRGKGIRPLLVLLSASMYKQDESLPDDALLCAMLVEMVHTTSLVHDDVIDEAYIRRGKPSAKALWRSHRSVLIGDYILAKSFSFAMDQGAFELLHYISKAMSDLCEGELLQSEQSDHLEMTREIYNEIIFKKTARLIGISSGVGALSVKADKKIVDAMGEFGDSLGMAFQIKDDILDYTDTENTGKPVCGDIRERKINLPLLTVLEKSNESQRKKIYELLSDVRNSPTNANTLCDLVIERGGLDMAAEVMEGHLEKARAILDQAPDSIYRTSLHTLCDYIGSRDK